MVETNFGDLIGKSHKLVRRMAGRMLAVQAEPLGVQSFFQLWAPPSQELQLPAPSHYYIAIAFGVRKYLSHRSVSPLPHTQLSLESIVLSLISMSASPG